MTFKGALYFATVTLTMHLLAPEAFGQNVGGACRISCGDRAAIVSRGQSLQDVARLRNCGGEGTSVDVTGTTATIMPGIQGTSIRARILSNDKQTTCVVVGHLPETQQVSRVYAGVRPGNSGPCDVPLFIECSNSGHFRHGAPAAPNPDDEMLKGGSARAASDSAASSGSKNRTQKAGSAE